MLRVWGSDEMGCMYEEADRVITEGGSSLMFFFSLAVLLFSAISPLKIGVISRIKMNASLRMCMSEGREPASWAAEHAASVNHPRQASANPPQSSLCALVTPHDFARRGPHAANAVST